MSDNLLHSPDPSKPLPPAGWYPDPHDGSARRYWDGAQWTAHTVVPDAATGAATSPAQPGSAPVAPVAAVGPVAPVAGVGPDGAATAPVTPRLPRLKWWQWALVALGALILFSIIVNAVTRERVLAAREKAGIEQGRDVFRGDGTV